jgi:hypothetical protein
MVKPVLYKKRRCYVIYLKERAVLKFGITPQNCPPIKGFPHSSTITLLTRLLMPVIIS